MDVVSKIIEDGKQTDLVEIVFSKSFDKIRNSLLRLVRFVDIGGFVDYRCLNFLFIVLHIINCTYNGVSEHG
jgi:hypothetical protein